MGFRAKPQVSQSDNKRKRTKINNIRRENRSKTTVVCLWFVWPKFVGFLIGKTTRGRSIKNFQFSCNLIGKKPRVNALNKYYFVWYLSGKYMNSTTEMFLLVILHLIHLQLCSKEMAHSTVTKLSNKIHLIAQNIATLSTI